MHRSAHSRPAALLRASFITVVFAVLAAVGLAAVQHVDRIRAVPVPAATSATRTAPQIAAPRVAEALLVAPSGAPMSTAAFSRRH